MCSTFWESWVTSAVSHMANLRSSLSENLKITNLLHCDASWKARMSRSTRHRPASLAPTAASRVCSFARQAASSSVCSSKSRLMSSFSVRFFQPAVVEQRAPLEMSLTCALSGEVPEVAVVSPVSGAVFERRLIEKHLANSDTDPVNGEPLTVDQLVELKTPKFVRPRMPAATSVPGLLKLFQDEWDATMLETFKLRQHVDKVRQELSHALYQHDAACRVIARLTRERDQARQALAALQAQGAAAGAAAAGGGADGAMEVEGGQSGISAAVADNITKTSKTLSKGRKKRTKAAELATADDIKAFTKTQSFPGLHSSNSTITALDLHATNDNLVLTAGGDKKAVLLDRAQGSVVAEFKGHSKKVSGALLHPTEDLALTCSHDNTVRVWNVKDASCVHTIAAHSKKVQGLSLHPTGDYVASAGDDAHWAFSDLHTGQTLVSVSSDSTPLTSVQFHPDGLILATGTQNSLVRIWQVKEQADLKVFEGHEGAITAIAFSENGYYLATAAEDARVKLWDLRKLDNFHTIELPEKAAVSALHFDYSGSYLAVGGSGLRVFGTKSWDEIAAFDMGAVSGAKFGTNARMLAACGGDRAVSILS
eukprot:m.26638 g.26638  ORF g.26638 m.26638 type:complete len:595 (+) comp11546_c0_seq1:365-2149(+)